MQMTITWSLEKVNTKQTERYFAERRDGSLSVTKRQDVLVACTITRRLFDDLLQPESQMDGDENRLKYRWNIVKLEQVCLSTTRYNEES